MPWAIAPAWSWVILPAVIRVVAICQKAVGVLAMARSHGHAGIISPQSSITAERFADGWSSLPQAGTTTPTTGPEVIQIGCAEGCLSCTVVLKATRGSRIQDNASMAGKISFLA